MKLIRHFSILVALSLPLLTSCNFFKSIGPSEATVSSVGTIDTVKPVIPTDNDLTALLDTEILTLPDMDSAVINDIYEHCFDSEYSQALSAYRELLLGRRTYHIYESCEELFYLYYTYPNDMCEFALVDINQDGIPELHFRSRAYTIFTYRDGEVHYVYSISSYVTLLNNNAIFSDHWAHKSPTSARRHYIEFGEDFEVGYSLYFTHNYEAGDYYIAYSGHDSTTAVSKQAFEAITAPIVSYCTDPRNYDMISWTNFGDWLEVNADEYIPLADVGWPRFDDEGNPVW